MRHRQKKVIEATYTDLDRFRDCTDRVDAMIAVCGPFKGCTVDQITIIFDDKDRTSDLGFLVRENNLCNIYYTDRILRWLGMSKAQFLDFLRSPYGIVPFTPSKPKPKRQVYSSTKIRITHPDQVAAMAKYLNQELGHGNWKISGKSIRRIIRNETLSAALMLAGKKRQEIIIDRHLLIYVPNMDASRLLFLMNLKGHVGRS